MLETIDYSQIHCGYLAISSRSFRLTVANTYGRGVNLMGPSPSCCHETDNNCLFCMNKWEKIKGVFTVQVCPTLLGHEVLGS